MNITNREEEALFRSKRIEGKSEYQAKSELIRDMTFLKEFNEIKIEKDGRLIVDASLPDDLDNLKILQSIAIKNIKLDEVKEQRNGK